MKFLSLFLLVTNILLVYSKVTFKVIAISGTPSVVINGKKYQMSEEEYPVYSFTLDDVNAPVDYHYVLGKEEEKFTRTLQSESTLNEFFNRKITVKKHPLLPMAFEPLSTLKKSKLFDDTHIATVVIEGSQSDIDYMNANPNKEKKLMSKLLMLVHILLKSSKMVLLKLVDNLLNIIRSLVTKLLVLKLITIKNYLDVLVLN